MTMRYVNAREAKDLYDLDLEDLEAMVALNMVRSASDFTRRRAEYGCMVWDEDQILQFIHSNEEPPDPLALLPQRPLTRIVWR